MPKPSFKKVKVFTVSSCIFAIITLIYLSFSFDTFVAQYHLNKLEEAKSMEEANVWLDKLIESSSDPEISKLIVQEIGPGSPKQTFWFFHRILFLAENLNAEEDHSLSKFADLLPLVKEIENRIHQDEKFLAYLGHFLRWCGSDFWNYIDKPSKPPRRLGLFEALVGSFIGGIDLNLDRIFVDHFQNEPKGSESILRLIMVMYHLEAWILKVELPPKFSKVEISQSNNESVILDNIKIHELNVSAIDQKLEKWIKENKERMVFDKSTGRFIFQKTSDGKEDKTPLSKRKVTIPNFPFPDWYGEAPMRVSESIPSGAN